MIFYARTSKKCTCFLIRGQMRYILYLFIGSIFGFFIGSRFVLFCLLTAKEERFRKFFITLIQQRERYFSKKEEKE